MKHLIKIVDGGQQGELNELEALPWLTPLLAQRLNQLRKTKTIIKPETNQYNVIPQATRSLAGSDNR